MNRSLPALLVLVLATWVRAEDIAEQARRLAREAIVFDGHCDTVLALEKGRKLEERSSEGHLDLVRAREGGLKIQLFALWPDDDYYPDRAALRTLQLLDLLQQAAAKNPGLALVETVSAARLAARGGRLAAFIGIEGGHAIQNDLALLRIYHALGVRLMTLTWMKHTDWADSSGEPPRHHGLTDFGRQVVAEMNRLGMVIDLSHVSDDTFYQVLELSRQPVLVSHSACRALCNHPRNVTDDMLRALAKNNSVIGINFFAGFLDEQAARLSEKFWSDMDRLWQEHKNEPDVFKKLVEPLRAQYRRDFPRVPIERLVDHIEHAAKVAGVEHVALGSDFDGICCPPEGLEDVSKLPALIEALLRRGFTEQQVRLILGENLLRLFGAVLGG